jgi:hypothetical protein
MKESINARLSDMVRQISIQYDVQAAQKLAEKRWGQGIEGLREWALEADVSILTLRKWLDGDHTIKLRTVEDIVRPLGLNAVELIRKNGNGKKAS